MEIKLQLRGNRTEIWRDDCAKNWVNFINWSHMELKNLNDKVLLLAMKQDRIFIKFSKNTQTKIREMVKQPEQSRIHSN